MGSELAGWLKRRLSRMRDGAVNSSVLPFLAMSPVRAHVLNGRIVVDEPTDLPEGTEVYLASIDALDAEERASLEKSIEDGYADFDRGDYVDARAFAKELLGRT
jgi:hypothetical protein